MDELGCHIPIVDVEEKTLHLEEYSIAQIRGVWWSGSKMGGISRAGWTTEGVLVVEGAGSLFKMSPSIPKLRRRGAVDVART